MSQQSTEAGPATATAEQVVEQIPARSATHDAPITAGHEATYSGGLCWVSVLVGLWVAISPWLLQIPFGGPQLANASTGLAVAVLALVAMSDVRGPVDPRWVNVALGGWVVASPFVFIAAGAGVPSYLSWSDIVGGAVIMVLSAAAGAAVSSERQRT